MRSNTQTSLPLVSIIVRTKDRPQMLQAALQSIKQQGYRPLEVVLVNDGGEEVFSLADAILSDQSITLTYLHNAQSLGRTNAANQGLNRAQGTFCLFLDDDDLLDHDHIEVLVSAHTQNFTNGQLGICHCQARAASISDDEEEHFLSIQGEECDRLKLLYQNRIPIMTALFNTSLRDSVQFDDSFDLFEDWDFWLQMTQHCQLHFVCHTSCTYRIHPNASDAREHNKAKLAYQKVYDKWLPSLALSEITALISASHQWHETEISSIQKQQQQELSNIGDLHEHALKVIQEKDHNIRDLDNAYHQAINVINTKDEDIDRLSTLHAQAIETIKQKDLDIGKLANELTHSLETIEQKDNDIAHLSTLHSQALDVIAEKDEDVAHLSSLHSYALSTIATKDQETGQLAEQFEQAIDYIAQLEKSLVSQREAHEQGKRELEDLLNKPWYMRILKAMTTRKKH